MLDRSLNEEMIRGREAAWNVAQSPWLLKLWELLLLLLLWEHVRLSLLIVEIQELFYDVEGRPFHFQMITKYALFSME